MLGFSVGKPKNQFTADGCYTAFRGKTVKIIVKLTLLKVIKLQAGSD